MSSHASRGAIYAAFFGNLLVAITKFIAAGITGSSAMLAEGIHSVVDTGNQVLLLLGLKRAQRPADERFPFGHGKEIYFWSFIVAILVFALGAGLSIYEGVHHLLHPVAVEKVLVNYLVLTAAILFEGFSWMIALRAFRKAKGRRGYFAAVRDTKDPTLFVVLFEDSAAMLGLLLVMASTAIGHATGWLWVDGVASISVGLLLAGTALWLAKETMGLLIGEAAMPETVLGIRRLVSAYPQVVRVNEVLTMHFGPQALLVNLSVDFRDDLETGELEAAIGKMDRALKQQFPEISRVFIEAEATV